MPTDDQLRLVSALISRQRWCAMATQGVDGPLASMVAYALDADASGFLLHLSKLAPHTSNLLEHATASLVISEADDDEIADPQTLARLTITGTVEAVERSSDSHQSARRAYLQRLPSAEQLFGFADFVLFRLRPSEARFVGGFAQAHTLSRDTLIKCMQDTAS
jgi:putative heme iron utilization protein